MIGIMNDCFIYNFIVYLQDEGNSKDDGDSALPLFLSPAVAEFFEIPSTTEGKW